MRFSSAILLLSLLSSSLPAAEITEIRGSTMGTTYSIKWVAGSDQIGKSELQQAVDQQLSTINRQMSTYDPESEISRLNASESTDWFDVSPATARVAERALEIAKLSQGAFDPTVGRLVGMWSFGADHREYAPPPAAKIQQALSSVGFQLVEARVHPPAIRKTNPDVQLDFSAIAKGYAVDVISELLAEHKLADSLVEIGGEVRTRGLKNGKPWTLGIERPAAQREGLAATIRLENHSLATSGDYRNYFEKDGQRFSHTIDPQTGYPVNHQLASVSVVTPDCMSADAFATTLMVLGPERGLAFADEQQIAAYFLVREGDGYREFTSRTGENLFQTQQPPAEEATGANLFSMFLITLAAFGIAILGLAVGVIFSNRKLQGSCGGMSAMKDEHGRSICEMCTTPPEECDRLREQIVKSCPNESPEETC